jgi:hypothetical protein
MIPIIKKTRNLSNKHKMPNSNPDKKPIPPIKFQTFNIPIKFHTFPIHISHIFTPKYSNLKMQEQKKQKKKKKKKKTNQIQHNKPDKMQEQR